MIGGDAQRFHSTYQFKVAREKDLVLEEESTGASRKIGSRHIMTCKRNKLGREGNSQRVSFDLYINGGIDWYSPLVRQLAEEYTTIMGKSGGWYKWKHPNCQTIDPSTGEASEISTEETYREGDMARMIYHSTDAKELIRTAFGIPALPPAEVVEEIEKENKKKRARKKLSDDGPQVEAL